MTSHAKEEPKKEIPEIIKNPSTGAKYQRSKFLGKVCVEAGGSWGVIVVPVFLKSLCIFFIVFITEIILWVKYTWVHEQTYTLMDKNGVRRICN